MTRWARGLNFLCSAKRRENWNAVAGQWLWIYKVTLVGCVLSHSRQACSPLGIRPMRFLVAWMIMIMNVDIYINVNTVQSCGVFLQIGCKKERKNLHDLVDCVNAMGLNAPPFSQVKSRCPKNAPPSPRLVVPIFITDIPLAVGLDLAPWFGFSRASFLPPRPCLRE